MLKRTIRTLRNKPTGVRNNIAMAAAGVCTVAIFAGWQYLSPESEPVATETKNGGTVAEFSNFFDRIGEQAAAVKESLGNIGSSTEQEAGVTDEVMVSSETSQVSALRSEARQRLNTAQTDSSTSTIEFTDTPKPIRIVTVKSTTSSSTNDQ